MVSVDSLSTSRILKHGETFAVFDPYGDINFDHPRDTPPDRMGKEGIYHEGTRLLSCLMLRLGRDRPLFLSSPVKDINRRIAVDLTNPDLSISDQVVIPSGTLHLFRTKFLWQGACYERLRIRNYGLAAVKICFSLQFEADFADIFEVRGTKRKNRGRSWEAAVQNGTVLLAYEGLDGLMQQTRLAFSPQPQRLSGFEARYEVSLPPQGEETFFLTISCAPGGTTAPQLPYDQAYAAAGAALRSAREQACDISTSNEQFNDWLNRSSTDLHMMTTETPEDPYPYAGVPWFSTAFGRDGILTALESLWLCPRMARGVLTYLAATQAKAVIPEQEAEPGKILHETRRGEMAALGEVPFGCYYGSVDSTPLFVLLAGAYHERTGDRAFLEAIWPNIELALQWIDTYGDADGDGFIEYLRHSPKGLVHQGWKDSHNAVFHADGTLADGPIALCEVQGYVYAAKRGAAALASVLGQTAGAQELLRQAQTLQERFEQAFWCEGLSTYALALDGAKRLCQVRTSNAGQCLFTGIASQEHARRTAQTLLHDDAFSGWGIRTLSASEARYNPMSYHNGSIWPHDNALIAYGLARYRLKESVLQIMTGLFEASLFVDLYRMPELFCGFPRRPGEGPILYPVACAPQSWAAAAVYLLLQACLGLEVKAPKPKSPLPIPACHCSLRRSASPISRWEKGRWTFCSSATDMTWC